MGVGVADVFVVFGEGDEEGEGHVGFEFEEARMAVSGEAGLAFEFEVGVDHAHVQVAWVGVTAVGDVGGGDSWGFEW